jgi:hypothetical protein
MVCSRGMVTQASRFPLDRGFGRRHALSRVAMERSITAAVATSLCAVAILAAGCATANKGRDQRIVVESVPAGATILVDGREVGRTPRALWLARMNGYQITVRKTGFTDATDFVRTVANEYDAKFLRLGADYATGAMNDLVPSSFRFELRPAILPEVRGSDPYYEMTSLVLEADSMRDRGEISRRDHRYIVRKIVEFYEGK